MLTAGSLVRQAREAAHLTQAELAERMGTTQSVIARLESGRSDPRVGTLHRAVAAAGRSLELKLAPGLGLDETLIAANLRHEPHERLRQFASAYSSIRRLREAGESALGS